MEQSITQREEGSIGPVAKLVFVGGWKSGSEVAVNRENFFIGRSRNNNLVLDDRSVSRKHAVINFLGGQFTLSDLNSFKGTYVNSEKIHETQIIDGDKLKIGDITLEFRTSVAAVRMKKKKKMILPLTIFAAAVFAVIFILYFALGKTNSIETDLMRELEYNYNQGVKAYNVDKNDEEARMYWNKVLELDPSRKSVHARKAKILLNNLDSNSGSN